MIKKAAAVTTLTPVKGARIKEIMPQMYIMSDISLLIFIALVRIGDAVLMTGDMQKNQTAQLGIAIFHVRPQLHNGLIVALHGGFKGAKFAPKPQNPRGGRGDNGKNQRQDADDDGAFVHARHYSTTLRHSAKSRKLFGFVVSVVVIHASTAAISCGFLAR